MTERDLLEMQKIYGPKKNKNGKIPPKERLTTYGTVSTPTPRQIQEHLENLRK